ncbi:chlorophyllase [Streptomyces sp. NPDC088194]|uniref:alpha/beta hydrolase family protein n=1 Tax=Streptomyces sp. NPDC088194 TaxID=3154931 RepID=UPI00344F6BCE
MTRSDPDPTHPDRTKTDRTKSDPTHADPPHADPTRSDLTHPTPTGAVGGARTPRIVSVKPIALDAPDRGEDLRVRVTAPVSGRDLPVIVFSHGFGSSADGYGPLTDYWAAHGFVVVQPTHLDSRTVGLPADDPRTPRIWRHRVADVKRVLDRLDLLEAAVPGLGGRVDRSRVAAAGHSFGGQTAGNLLGLRVLDPDSGTGEDLSDPRVRAGVLLATAGRGGADLSAFAAENYPFMNADFTHMAAPALVVAGDRDDSPMTVRGPDWLADPYVLSPGDKSLLTLFGAEHSLGGIPGYEARETTDEHPGRLALIQRATTAYFRHTLGLDDSGWTAVREELADGASPLGRIESKSPSRP